MSTHNICFLREIRKMPIFGQVNLVGQVDSDHLLVREQVVKFDCYAVHMLDSSHSCLRDIEHAYSVARYKIFIMNFRLT